MIPVQCALYARVSSESQARDNTIASQVVALRERIGADGFLLEPDHSYEDEGYSGSILSRPALERLRDAVAGGHIERIYVHAPDRLARRYAHQVLLVDEFRRAGAEVVFLNRAIGGTAEDDLLLQVQGVIAEYERAKILERSRRGRRHAARSGSVSALTGAPFGYRYVSRVQGGGVARFEVVEDEAHIVGLIFSWIGLDRLSLREACRRLHQMGCRTRRGSTYWYASTIRGMLDNPAYMGRAAFGRAHFLAPRPRLRSDLRERVIEAGLTGPSLRQAAGQFAVAASTAIGWVKRLYVEGERGARRQGRPRGSKLDPHKEFLLSRLQEEPDMTLERMQRLLSEERGVRASLSTIWGLLDQAKQTFKKKSVHASEQDRPDVVEKRQAWFEGQLDLDPSKLVFIDETWATTNMAPRYGWSLRGERLRAGAPLGNRKKTTFVAGLRLTGMTAPMALDGSINGARFLDCVRRVLAPTLTPGDMVIIDNLTSHKSDKVGEAIEAVGATVCFLPPYSPDFNPIEQAFAKLKQLLRTAAARTLEAVRQAIEDLLASITPIECANFFAACGYDQV